MNLKERKLFEKWASNEGINIMHSDSKVKDNENPYKYDAAYFGYTGWCGAKNKIKEDLDTNKQLKQLRESFNYLDERVIDLEEGLDDLDKFSKDENLPK